MGMLISSQDRNAESWDVNHMNLKVLHTPCKLQWKKGQARGRKVGVSNEPQEEQRETSHQHGAKKRCELQEDHERNGCHGKGCVTMG